MHINEKGPELCQKCRKSTTTLTLIIYLQFGQSAMMVASWEGHLGIVEALISAEADANLQDGVIGILYSCNLYPNSCSSLLLQLAHFMSLSVRV